MGAVPWQDFGWGGLEDPGPQTESSIERGFRAGGPVDDEWGRSEAFDYPYREIANVLRLEEANARQVVTRARQRVAGGRRMAAENGDVAPVTTHLGVRSMARRSGHLQIPGNLKPRVEERL